jgi:hypothetical protein
MTIDDISKTLPNGFHDADLLGVEIDFEHATAAMDFAVDTSNSDMESAVVPRRGRLSLKGLHYFVVEPPNEQFAYDQQAQNIGSDSSDFTELSGPQKFPVLPDGIFAHWFYSSTDNNFLFVAAANAEFEWTE